jgi:SET domain-containing protein
MEKKVKKEKVYIPASVEIRRSKTGLGVFALEPLKKGDFIMEYIGKKVTSKYADEHPNRYLFEINSKWTIDGSPRYNKARYFNHACKPNCEVDIKKGRILIFALRNIKAGEELTYDYGEEYFDDYFKKPGCRCGFCDGTGKLIKTLKK